eukprot:TRINITY_DN33973_c0_g1_i1.p1 TRINITY_DN33973_c0_g1~~TRINITY_DN33973_c0_g1_i1.p1  ORF type:complete len:733 (-),score=107.77 TRINITY_DN33973_c0_g1_i1:67-2265(-)
MKSESCFSGCFGRHTRGYPPQAKSANQPPSSRSLVIIGMRGAGKTWLGGCAASALGWRFVDLDQHFEAAVGQNISSFVATEGWAAFRQKELDTLKQVLREFPDRTVVSCGGGIVETPAALAVLDAWHPVVHIMTTIGNIEAVLAKNGSRANLGEPPSVTWERRQPLYDRCSDFEFFLKGGEGEWAKAELDFVAFSRRVLRLASAPNFGNDSFFLSLTAKDVNTLTTTLPKCEVGVDALEIRVDLLENQSHFFVKEQLAVLRRHSTLPIVFTLRSKRQGGAFEGDKEEMFALLQIGFRAACEFVDIEADMEQSTLRGVLALARRGVSRLIGSHHDMSRMPPLNECKNNLRLCSLGGAADVAKLVVGCSQPEDCVALQREAAELRLPMPFIAINAGEHGKMSRVLNRVFTPVTHPMFPVKAAPGQMSASQIMQIRRSLGYFSRRSLFYIFGKPVSASPSPSIHNTGFGVNLAPFVYERKEVDTAEAALSVFRSGTCGGGSVSIPLKEALFPHMATVSESAAAIGAINTVTVDDAGELHGDNTDWLGIKRQFERKLSRCSNGSSEPKMALVIGAGGTARAALYALQAMKCSPILIYNRTTSRAEALAAEFKVRACESLSEIAALPRLDLVMGTVPGDGESVLPEELLARFRPVVFDAAYRPRDTPLLRAGRAAGCPIIEGAEMLFEQGCAQCEIWTRRPAPRAEIAASLIRDCFDPEEEIPEGLHEEVKHVGRST